MSESSDKHHAGAPTASVPSRIGVVVHPTRDIDQPLTSLRDWSAEHETEVVQIPVAGQERRVADEGEAAGCDLLVAIGGDGTMLAAIRAAAMAGRPALGVASGSLGALAGVTLTDVRAALDRFSRGDWIPRRLPALDIAYDNGDSQFAINDIAIVRAGGGQVRTSAVLDGTLFARFAGDGCIVSTPVGSSAYSLSAGGPLLALDVYAFLLTPLPVHGGFAPPLVADGDATLELDFSGGYSGVRLEVDGQVSVTEVGAMTIRLRDGVATAVRFDDQEPFITGLRRRQIILDSPRILAEDARGQSIIKNS
jgi:NAD+ kinase